MGSPGRKHTDEEIARRREDVRRVLASGRWSAAAARAIADKHGVTFQQVADFDRRIVLAEIRDSVTGEERERAVALWFGQVNEVYARSMEKGDRSNAVKALALLSRALGIETTKIEHSGAVGVEVSARHVDEAIRRLLEGG